MCVCVFVSFLTRCDVRVMINIFIEHSAYTDKMRYNNALWDCTLFGIAFPPVLMGSQWRPGQGAASD